MDEATGVGVITPMAGGTATDSQSETKPTNSQPSASEKTIKPAGEAKSDTTGKPGVANSQSERAGIPYERFAEVNDRLKVAEEKAKLLDQLQQNPDLASTFLQNIPQRDPVLAEAQKQLKEMGYITSSEVQDLLQTSISEAISKHDFEKGFIQKVQDLGTKYDGKNGAPKFEGEAVAKFMDDNGISDPEVAYEVMNKEALADWRASSKTGTTYTEKPGTPIREGSDNQKNDLDEATRRGDFSDYLKKYHISSGKQ